VTTLYVWCDTGPQHFKIYKLLAYFCDLQAHTRVGCSVCFCSVCEYTVTESQVPVELNFFGSYHGHNLCDSHTGCAKRALRWKTAAGLHPRSIGDVLANYQELPNTTALLLQNHL